MRECGQELVLEYARFLGPGAERLLAREMLRPLLLHPPPLGDVAREDADPLAAGVRDEIAGGLERHLAAVGAPVGSLVHVAPARARLRPDPRPALGRAVDLELPHPFREQLVARVAGEARGGRVDVDDVALGVDPEQGLGRVLDGELGERQSLALVVTAALVDQQHAEDERAERQEQSDRQRRRGQYALGEVPIGKRGRPHEHDRVERHAEQQECRCRSPRLAPPPPPRDGHAEQPRRQDRSDAGRAAQAAEPRAIAGRHHRGRQRRAGSSKRTGEQHRDDAGVGDHAGRDDERRVHGRDRDQREQDAGGHLPQRARHPGQVRTDDAVEQREREE